jgi:endonuclease/exonuclease/phosphatase family metal-dependent hydrolase
MSDIYTTLNNDFLKIESDYENLLKNKSKGKVPDYISRRINRVVNTNKYVKIVKYAQENSLNNIIEKSENTFRICTYNVHYFSKNILDTNEIKNNLPTITEVNSIEMVTDAIININPDILCTQEITFGITKDQSNDAVQTDDKCINVNYDTNKIFNDINLSLVSFCSIIPSWFKVPYGNAIWINNIFKEKNGICKDLSCSDVEQDYDILPRNKNYVTDKKLIETKCFIKITLFNKIDIICLHLDAVSKNIKLNMLQLDKINSILDKPTIITGDFNLVRRIDNLKSNEYIEMIYQRYKWIEAFDAIEVSHTMTSSDLSEKDYFFFAKFDNYDLKKLIKNVSVYFTDASDHLPLILDLNMDYIDQYIVPDTISKKEVVWGRSPSISSPVNKSPQYNWNQKKQTKNFFKNRKMY